MPVCGRCEHYRGGGDFGLCCELEYWLHYEDSPACERFEQTGRACNITSAVYGFRCSQCAFFMHTAGCKIDVCPNCGAVMENEGRSVMQ